MPECRNAGMPECRNAGMPECRNAGMPDKMFGKFLFKNGNYTQGKPSREEELRLTAL